MSAGATEQAKNPRQATPSDGHIVFDDVNLSFGERRVLHHLSFAIPKGKITVVLGGSGVGKSTVLRLIGGLIRPDSGRIIVDGTDISGFSENRMYPVRRKLGMMFQGGALLDATNIFDNLAFPLREHTDKDEAQIAHEVYECLLRMGLMNVEELLPSELSGGMVKRVALARAIITKPVILLCDEPFSGLDPITTKRIELLLQKINEELGITIVAISHDPASTMRMAHHLLALLPDSTFEGNPQELSKSRDPRLVNLLRTEVDERVVLMDDLVERWDGKGRGGPESTWA